MLRIRYMIVDHDKSLDGQLHVRDGAFQNALKIAPFVPVHHWTRITDTTVFVKGTYYDAHHKRLMEMDGVTVLPSTFSRQTVHNAIHSQGNVHHHTELTASPVPYDESSITSDLVDWMALNGSGVFDHEV